MNPNRLTIFSITSLLAILNALPIFGQSNLSEEDDSDIRNGAVEMEENQAKGDNLGLIPLPSYINKEANVLKYNGADWSQLYQSLGEIDRDPFTIVHIGDSHLQADFATSVTRQKLQYDYGDAGRGIITPLKISGTNQPFDYEFSSHDLWQSVKLMKQPWKMTMGFTGTSISPTRKSSRLTIGIKEDEDNYSPFTSLTIFHHGRLKINEVTDKNGNKLKFVASPSKDYTEIDLEEPSTAIELHLTGAADLVLFGVSLSGDRPGLFYHTIGNNGATYATYNNIGTVGKGIAPLQPDLVIISLGTNEAFGKVNKAGIYENIDLLVNDIKENNPDAQLLLVTPMECQKSEYRTTTRRQTVKGRKNRKGKKSNRKVNKQVRVRTGRYTVNPNVAIVRDIINRYGEDHHIAVYDWYEVAGGAGASSQWVSDGLFSKDHVHHSRKGYTLQGEMMYDVLKNSLDPQGSYAPLPSLIPLE